MDALVTKFCWNTTELWFGLAQVSVLKRTELWWRHGCSSHCILLGHERIYGLGMDASATVFSPNTTKIMVKTKCSGQRILLKQIGPITVCSLGMHAPVSILGTRKLWFGLDALVTVFCWNKKIWGSVPKPFMSLLYLLQSNFKSHLSLPLISPL